MTFTKMYAQQKSYSKLALGTTTATSSMIWGSQWDQIVIWMKEVENTIQNSKYVMDATGMENNEVKKVYDLVNIRAWTLCSSSGDSRTLRRRRYSV